MTWPDHAPPACRDVADVERAAPVSGYYPLLHPRSASGHWTVAELLVYGAGHRLWSFPGVEEHGDDADLVGARIGPAVALPAPGGPRPVEGDVVYEID